MFRHDAMSDVVTRFKVARVRSPAHLERLRLLPCCVPGCNRRPVDAHHITFAQLSARGLKVSDEFVVPLCHWVHHDPRSAESVHFVGNERNWWTRQGTDPLKLAEQLWAETQASEEASK
jgi:hypothetical protein